MSTLLRVAQLDIFYGRLQALRNVSLDVEAGSITSVFGANGAGKSTLLRAISGIIAVRSGSIVFRDREIQNRRANDILRAGIAHVPEGRELFRGLSVTENLLLGGYLRSRAEIEESQRFVFHTFPILEERRTQRAGMLSGGEQQMLAIGRALMSQPTLLTLDEPSLGLAPGVRDDVLGVIRRLNREQGVTVLMVEQEVRTALEMSDACLVLESASIVASGTPSELSASDEIAQFYLGGVRN